MGEKEEAVTESQFVMTCQRDINQIMNVWAFRVIEEVVAQGQW